MSGVIVDARMENIGRRSALRGGDRVVIAFDNDAADALRQ